MVILVPYKWLHCFLYPENTSWAQTLHHRTQSSWFISWVEPATNIGIDAMMASWVRVSDHGHHLGQYAGLFVFLSFWRAVKYWSCPQAICQEFWTGWACESQAAKEQRSTWFSFVVTHENCMKNLLLPVVASKLLYSRFSLNNRQSWNGKSKTLTECAQVAWKPEFAILFDEWKSAGESMCTFGEQNPSDSAVHRAGQPVTP
jgi:hypothetical protein